jgi:hypothetical protein
MTFDRRNFLQTSLAFLSAGTLAARCGGTCHQHRQPRFRAAQLDTA